MKIKTISVREFKRFTDLRIEDLPESTRLVVMAGPNGAGKSSLFEALNFYNAPFRGVNYQEDYHRKASDGPRPPIDWSQIHAQIQVAFHNATMNPHLANDQNKKAFYFRSAYRHEGDFSSTNVGNVQDALEDTRRPAMLISSEARVSDNFSRLVASTVAAIYDGQHDAKTVAELRERLIGRIREAMKRVFGDLVLTGTGNPMTGGTFLFDKGTSKNFRYKNLSGGEKAAFDLLLDFIVKAEFFDDTVFCIDEPELHMHTRLQARLLEELYSQLPPKCQLWIATHSIGMMRAAKEVYLANPGEVVFLDFEGNDYDATVVMKPVPVDRELWRRMFRVALDDLSELVAPSEIVFCEGRLEGSRSRRNTTFDAEVYRTIFKHSHPDTEFVPLGGNLEIEQNSVLVGDTFKRLFETIQVWNLLDRDDRTDATIAELEQKGTRVLKRRDLENYLWDDSIIAKLCAKFGQPDKTAELQASKAQFLESSAKRGRPADDVKAISGDLFVAAKKQLGLVQQGNTAVEFCKMTLAPLMTPDLAVYRELEDSVFGTTVSSARGRATKGLLNRARDLLT